MVFTKRQLRETEHIADLVGLLEEAQRIGDTNAETELGEYIGYLRDNLKHPHAQRKPLSEATGIWLSTEGVE